MTAAGLTALATATAFWVLSQGWWIHAAVLTTLYGPDFVL